MRSVNVRPWIGRGAALVLILMFGPSLMLEDLPPGQPVGPGTLWATSDIEEEN